MVESNEGLSGHETDHRRHSKSWILWLVLLLLVGAAVMAFVEFRFGGLEREFEEFRAVVKEERAEQERLRSRVSGLVDNSEQLEYDLSIKDEEVAGLVKEMLTRYDQEITASRESVDELRMSLSKLNQTVGRLSEQQNRIQEAVGTLSSDVRLEVAANRDFLKDLNGSVQNLETEVNRRFREVEDFQTSLQEMEERLAKMREDGATVESVKRLLESEIQKTTTTLDGITARLDDLRVEFERIRREVSRGQF